MKKVLLLVLSICVGFKGFSQWQQMETPKGIQVNNFQISNDDFFACTSNGLYKNILGFWDKVGNDFNFSISTLVYHENYYFAGTSSNGIYRSSDEGNTWLQVNNNLTSIVITEIHIYDNKLFAGTANGLFMSDNNGVQWVDMSNNLANKSITSVLSYNDSLFIGTQNGVYISSDTAKSWTLKNTGLTSNKISKIMSVESKLFASTNGGVFVSEDTAKTWIAVNSGLTNLDVNDLYYNQDTLFAGTTDGLYYTTNLTTISWQSLLMNLPSEQVLALNELNGSLTIGNTFGVFQKKNEVISMNRGFPEWIISSSFSYDSLLFIKTNKGIWELNQLNNEWSYCTLFPGNLVDEIMDYNDTTILMYNSSGIYKSHDTLKTWTRISSNTKITSIDTLNSYIYFGTENAGVYRSADLGENWIQMNIGLLENSIIDIICNKEKIFVATNKSEYGSKIYGSTNYGDEWYQISDLVDWSAVISKGISLDTAILFQTERMYYSISTSTELMDTIKPEYIYQGATFGIQNTMKINDAIVFGSRFKPLYPDAQGVGIYISKENCKNFVQINKGLPSSQYQYYPYGTVYTPIVDLEYSSKSLDLFALLSDNKLMIRNINNLAILPTPTDLAMSSDSLDYQHFRLNFEWQNHAENATDMILVQTDNPHGGVSVGDLNFIKQVSSTYDTSSLFMEQWSYEIDSYKASTYQIIACDSGDCSLASKPAIDTIYATSISENVIEEGIDVEVFPNPVTNGYLNINIKDNSEYDITIYNSVGVRISGISLYSKGKIDLNNQHSGIYLLVLKNTNTLQSKSFKIMVQ